MRNCVKCRRLGWLRTVALEGEIYCSGRIEPRLSFILFLFASFSVWISVCMACGIRILFCNLLSDYLVGSCHHWSSKKTGSNVTESNLWALIVMSLSQESNQTPPFLVWHFSSTITMAIITNIYLCYCVSAHQRMGWNLHFIYLCAVCLLFPAIKKFIEWKIRENKTEETRENGNRQEYEDELWEGSWPTLD